MEVSRFGPLMFIIILSEGDGYAGVSSHVGYKPEIRLAIERKAAERLLEKLTELLQAKRGVSIDSKDPGDGAT